MEKVRRIQPEGYPASVNSSWDISQRRDFHDAFEYIATAFSRCKKDDVKLLLSTCLTHRHTYNAVAFEAHSWIDNDRGDFQGVLDGALTLGGASYDPNCVATPIYWCTRYIAEAGKKYDVFHHRFDGLRREAEKLFTEQGPAAARFWRLNIVERGLLDASPDHESEVRFSSLMPLIHQMASLTTFLTQLLLQAGY